MSRSSAFDAQSHPCTRWLEWQGEKGLLRYYDRDTKTTCDVPLPFSFLLLDTLACVRGWHDESRSAITSNEVRDTTLEPLVVKAFKSGTLVEGLYRDIRDAVVRQGGKYHASLYLAFCDEAGLRIGNLRLKGAALQSWSEFKKAHKSRLYVDAIKLAGVEEGKKGRVVYRVPRFEVLPAAAEMHAAAQVFDQQLQAYLASYLQTNRREQADAADDQHDVAPQPPQPLYDSVAITDDPPF
jgi:hypothetical protein